MEKENRKIECRHCGHRDEYDEDEYFCKCCDFNLLDSDCPICKHGLRTFETNDNYYCDYCFKGFDSDLNEITICENCGAEVCGKTNESFCIDCEEILKEVLKDVL